MKGTVISFDRIKGYGFVATEVGGDDVFIHVNDLHSEKDLLTVGSLVEFRFEEGERGPKASAVTVLTSAPSGSASAAAPSSAATSAAPSSAPSRAVYTGEDPDTADVLSAAEYQHELTEALLRVEPELTGRQIVEIRKRLARIGQEHGWVDR